MERRQRFSRVTLLTAIVSTVIVGFCVLIFAVVIPNMNAKRDAQRVAAREDNALWSIFRIQEAETLYKSQYGRYATTLAELRPGSTAAVGPAPENFISQSVASGRQGGYLFALAGNQSGYRITALPEAFGQTGRRSFYADQTGAIRNNWSAEPATEKSDEVK